MSHSPGLFDLDERYAARSKIGDALERLASVVDFEMFRAGPDASLLRSDRSKGGRPPADERTGFRTGDRPSFMRFPGLDLHGRVADARTIRLLRKHLTGAKAVDALFARFDAHLKERGYPGP